MLLGGMRESEDGIALFDIVVVGVAVSFWRV